MDQEIKMPSEADKIAQNLRQKILEGYSEKFKDEFLNPRNIGEMENPDSHVRITRPCMDTVEMYLAIRNEEIDDIKFTTGGCGATIACASYVTRMAKGKSIEEALRMKPEDLDNHLEALPEENKHCAKLAVISLKATLEDIAVDKTKIAKPCMHRAGSSSRNRPKSAAITCTE